MLEGHRITSQQTIFAVLQERQLNLLPRADVMCIKNHCAPSSPLPIFLWLSEVVCISTSFMLVSQGDWNHGGAGVD